MIDKYQDDEILLDGSTYKIGLRYMVFRLSGGEWVHSTKEPAEIIKAIDKREEERLKAFEAALEAAQPDHG